MGQPSDGVLKRVLGYLVNGPPTPYSDAFPAPVRDVPAAEAVSDDAPPVLFNSVPAEGEEVSEEMRKAMRQEMKDAQSSRRKLPEGTRVRVTYEAVTREGIFDGNPAYLSVTRVGEGGDQFSWYDHADAVTVEVIPPDIVPGTVLSANGRLWNVRLSANHVSLRICPADARNPRVSTLPIEDFFTRWPKAKILFDPRKKYHEEEPLADWEAELLGHSVANDPTVG